MSSACTPILVGVTSPVSEILLPSKMAKFPFRDMDYRPSAIGGVIRGFGFSQPSCSTRLKMAHSFTHKMYSISSQILRKVLRLKPFKLVYYKDKA